MKSNQKGFTLIELLAVIVILAIIALIATPIVLNIINKARKSAAADSVYGVMEAMKLAYTESMLETSYALPLVVEFTQDGNTMKQGDPATEIKDANDKNVTLKLSGTAPSSGSLTLKADGEFTATDLKVNTLTCTIGTDKKVSCS